MLPTLRWHCRSRAPPRCAPAGRSRISALPSAARSSRRFKHEAARRLAPGAASGAGRPGAARRLGGLGTHRSRAHLRPAGAERDRADALAGPCRSRRRLAGDDADHVDGAPRRGRARHADRRRPRPVAPARAGVLSLPCCPAGHADRRNRAPHHYLGRQPVGSTPDLRLDRRLLPDRRQHHARPRQRRCRVEGPVPPLWRLALADAHAPAGADGTPLFSRGSEDLHRPRLDRRCGGGIRRRHRRQRQRARLSHPGGRLPLTDPAAVCRLAAALAHRHCPARPDDRAVAAAPAPMAFKRGCQRTLACLSDAPKRCDDLAGALLPPVAFFFATFKGKVTLMAYSFILVGASRRIQCETRLIDHARPPHPRSHGVYASGRCRR
ncbi:hypothetical protein DF3PB_2400005 [uncultured Defluviicoccus sp.]|uniref:Uncharacterized protein n=1 Tax=metagenome TaxID=256318 RepID=A0A380TCC4_9ZZZZ|nr:hypothetical protein DF3PB_2400005 [uncultured Defluviicoccus sp.]